MGIIVEIRAGWSLGLEMRLYENSYTNQRAIISNYRGLYTEHIGNTHTYTLSAHPRVNNASAYQGFLFCIIQLSLKILSLNLII